MEPDCKISQLFKIEIADSIKCEPVYDADIAKPFYKINSSSPRKNENLHVDERYKTLTRRAQKRRIRRFFNNGYSNKTAQIIARKIAKKVVKDRMELMKQSLAKTDAHLNINNAHYISKERTFCTIIETTPYKDYDADITKALKKINSSLSLSTNENLHIDARYKPLKRTNRTAKRIAKEIVIDRMARIKKSLAKTDALLNINNAHYVSPGRKFCTKIETTSPNDYDADITKSLNEINSSSNSSNNENVHIDEHYETLKRHRISNLIENDIETAVAIELELERRNIYNAYLACQQAEKYELIFLQSLGDNKQQIDDYLSEEDRSRIDELVKNGIFPDIAEQMIKENLSIPLLELKQKSSQHSIINNTNDTKLNVNPEFEVSIVHCKHPIVKLTDYEIQMLKSNLIEEIRRTGNVVLDFMEFIPQNGWLALTCCNRQTKLWLYEMISCLKLIPNIQLKLINSHEPLNFVAKIALFPANVVPPTILLALLQVQNQQLQTDKWELIEVKTMETGIVIVYFSITPECRKYLTSTRIRLILNGKKIDVEVIK